MLRKPSRPRAPRLGKEEEGAAIPLARWSSVATNRKNDADRRAPQPGDAMLRGQPPGEELRGGSATKKAVAAARSILKSGSSAASAAASSLAVAKAGDGTREEQAEIGGRSNGCIRDSRSGGEGIELDRKSLNVAASGAFYERAKSRRQRLKRALSENSTSQAEAIPLGGGGWGTESGSDRKKKHKTNHRGSVLAPELPEAAAEPASSKSAAGIGARKRPSGDVDPYWNDILLRKKAREEKERQKLAKRWRSSIVTVTRCTSVGSSGTTSTKSASGTKSTGQPKRHSTGKMSDLKQQQHQFMNLTSHGIAGVTSGVVRTGKSAAVKAPHVEQRTVTAVSEGRLSAPGSSLTRTQGVLTLSFLGMPNRTRTDTGEPAVTRSDKRAARCPAQIRPGKPSHAPAPPHPEIIVIDD